MNLVDIILILILGVCFVLGFWNGLVKQLASILGIVAGVVVAARLAPRFASALHGRLITDRQVALIAAYVFVFILAALTVWLIGLLVRRLLKHAELGLVDRIWGALFGLVKGLVFCWALLLAIVLMSEQSSLHRQLQEGMIAPRLLVALNAVSVAFPRELSTRLDRTVKGWWESGVAPALRPPEEPPAQPSGGGSRRDYR